MVMALLGLRINSLNSFFVRSASSGWMNSNALRPAISPPAPPPAVCGPPSTLGPMAVQMAPSILSADFARLASEAEAVSGVADWLHVDVMDNHFVPNLTIGLPVVESLLKHTGLPLDCHLMIENADHFVAEFANAGADWISVHQEACRHLNRTLLPRGETIGRPHQVIQNMRLTLPTIRVLCTLTQRRGELAGNDRRHQKDDKCQHIFKFGDTQGIEGRNKEKIEREEGNE